MSKNIDGGAVNPQHILDTVTLKVAKTLLENPTIQYNQSTLAEAADVSRDALLRRWDTLTEIGLLQKADVESSIDHWKLNSDSEIANTLSKLIYTICSEGENQ
ncbi:hypothetical protein OB919_16025 [Halobacteria archaeon AArc-curdl1]|uniref:Uncharacterized protein n=1 Tax=Natronosalvus hydrolyticus TaxID=2979988 RepID=A0AAP2ZAQ5_9EURY|nr:hypothetical protein [Halobacteria archaeon AArc-curdl1]